MYRSACFTGHRTIKADISTFSTLLSSVIERLITDNGVTDFYHWNARQGGTVQSICSSRRL